MEAVCWRADGLRSRSGVAGHPAYPGWALGTYLEFEGLDLRMSSTDISSLWMNWRGSSSQRLVC